MESIVLLGLSMWKYLLLFKFSYRKFGDVELK